MELIPRTERDGKSQNDLEANFVQGVDEGHG